MRTQLGVRPVSTASSLKLGFEVSERSVSRYLARVRRPDGTKQLWLAFLRNHREAIAALDFFTVPTATFRVLYCLFVIEHDRRRILHFNVTQYPTREWIVQQLREAFPDSCPYRYVILDRDAKFNGEVSQLLEATGLRPTRTSVCSPWQNGVAERWVGKLPAGITGSRNHLPRSSPATLGPQLHELLSQ